MLKKLNRIKNPLIPLFLLVLIDHIGFGILFPILVPIFMDNQGILGAETTSLMKSFWYNLTLAVFPIALYFGAIFLGRLSDQFGRRRILIICLIGTSFAYFLAGLAVNWKCLSLLITSRVLAGFVSGSMPIAQAAVVDISSEADRAKNLGLIVSAGSIGFLLGPLIGGIFADSRILPWFSNATPFYVASLLACINLSFLSAFFKETFVPKTNRPLQLTHCFDLIAAPFIVKHIRFLSLIAFMFQMGWSLYFQFIGVFLVKKHQFTSQQISLFMFLIGIGLMLGSAWAIRILTKYLGDIQTVLVFLVLASLCILYTSLEDFGLFNWLSACLIGMAAAAIYALMIKFFSLTVSSEEQGWIMGVSEAIASIAWAISPLLSTYLEDISLVLPIQFATGLLIITALLLTQWKQPKPIEVTLQHEPI